MFLRDTKAISERTAIADAYGKQYTYGKLDGMSSEYKKYISKRSLVVILCDYSIETVAFYYCQMVNHAVPILIDKNLETSLALKIINAYEPQYIWCRDEARELFQEILSSIALQEKEHLLIRTSFEPYKMNTKLALLLTTSGSTGSLKLVRLSYENLRNNIKAFVERIGISKEDRVITTLPMHYCYGLSLLHMHWLMGASVYVTEYSMLDVRFWDFFEDSKITNFAGVPYTYQILKQIGFLDKRYDSLRFMTQGGGKLSEEQQEEFGIKLRQKNVQLYICYGQTEATTYISALDYEKVVKKLGSVGSPFPGIKLSVKKPNDKGEGELVCMGKSISLGYAGDKRDLALDDENGECLHTGDIVFIDDEGDVFIKGRSSRFVKILGERISLDEMEAALSEYFMPVQFVCVGSDDRIRIYYLREGMEDDVLAFCRRKFSLPRKMIECRFIKELPYTSSGKLNYKALMI